MNFKILNNVQAKMIKSLKIALVSNKSPILYVMTKETLTAAHMDMYMAHIKNASSTMTRAIFELATALCLVQSPLNLISTLHKINLVWW